MVGSLQEKKAVEERLIKMGERDDSLPPEFRPTEEDRKVADAFTPPPPPPTGGRSKVASWLRLSNVRF